jgi:DNA repair protein RecO (recombination protein O)
MVMLHTPVVVLHRYAYSDSSWVVKALSPDAGILSLLVKGGKSKNSAFRTSLDPLSLSEVVLRYRQQQELHIPREAALQNRFPRLRERLEDLALAQVMAEILLRLGSAGGHAAEEFHLLRRTLERLEESPGTCDTLANFLSELCSILGYSPVMNSCVQCGETLLEIADLWPAMGGGVCAVCLGRKAPAYSKSFIQELLRFTEGHTAPEEKDLWLRLENFFLQYLRIHTGGLDNLRSLSWLAETRRLSAERTELIATP